MAIVRRTISLPPDLAREAEETARAEGKSVSAVVEEALRSALRVRLDSELKKVQGFWSLIARERGLLSETDLARYLAG